MHTLAVNSVSMLLSYLVTHSKCNFIPDAMKPHLNEVNSHCTHTFGPVVQLYAFFLDVNCHEN